MKEMTAAKMASLVLCLALCVAFPSCRSVKRCDVAVGDEECVATGPEMLNVRIGLVDQPDLHPSNTIWTEAGSALVAEWDTYTYFMSFSEVECDFSNLSQATNDCWACDLCDVSPTSEQRCPYIDVFALVTNNNPTIVFREGFMKESELAPVSSLNPTSGCSVRGSAPAPFTAASNGTYQLLSPELNTEYPSRPVLLEKKVFVIQNGMSQRTPFELTQYATNGVDKVWYRWTVKEDPVWEDNFSKNVRIGQVRILTGTKVIDPNTDRFQLADAKVVRPSRILFFSDFNPINGSTGSDILSHASENDNRCYVDDSKLDGDINLVGIPDPMMMRTRCRQDSPGSGTRERDFAASPTYLTLEPGSQLTWFVEFYEMEGADFDPSTPTFDSIPANAVLAIEFEIEIVS